jgi:hypothetical protein
MSALQDVVPVNVEMSALQDVVPIKYPPKTYGQICDCQANAAALQSDCKHRVTNSPYTVTISIGLSL